VAIGVEPLRDLGRGLQTTIERSHDEIARQRRVEGSIVLDTLVLARQLEDEGRERTLLTACRRLELRRPLLKLLPNSRTEGVV
jgi:hypothetical protein